MRRIGIIAALCCTAFAAQAGRGIETEHVVAIAEDQTLTLAGGDKARFADIIFPDAALAAPWLASHVLQHEIAFRTLDDDRYGRTVIAAAEVEEQLLREGVAVLFAQDHPRPEWLEAEHQARQARRGIWAHDGFVLTPENAAQHAMEFHVVEGTITHIYAARSATYLNFGEHWQTDFSVTIPARNRRGFEAVLDTLKPGSKIRVRGMLYEENGPMLRITRPEQLEVVK